MSEKSANLKLPFIQSAQAQKHVTHNDAITNLDILTQLTVEDKDLAIPPSSPTEGACYIVANAATGEWAGKENQLAAWQDGAWRYYEPAEGWVAWIKDEDTQTVYDGSTWNVLNNSGGGGSANLNPVTGGLVGINATADTTNKLSLNSDASLFNHDGTDHQLKINKNLATNNASVLFQTGFSGRAEFGITGDDDFHMKVSPDGTTFYDGIVIDKDTGEVSFPNTTFSGGGTAVNSVYGRTGNVIAETNDYTFDQIGGVSQNVLMGRLTSGTGVQEALSASEVRSFLNIEDNATADQTGSEIKSLLFTEADTNNFDDAHQSKLATIEPAATADQTGAEIKALYEAEANTNAFDDAAVSKLSAIEPLADVTDEANVITSLNGSSLASVTVAADDKILIQDLSDSDNVKTVTAQSIADLSTGNNADVVGPSNSTDFRIVLFDGTTGKIIKELDAGTSGQFLKSQGDGVTPIWENISGGGDVLAANNLSDIQNAATARSNLGLEIGVDVAAVGSTSPGVSSDLLALALKVADLEGDALGITDGIADPFDDESDIDLTESLNETYNQSSGFYNVASGNNLVPVMTGSTTAGVTVSVDSVNSDRYGWEVFDRISATTDSRAIWHSGNNGGAGWLKVDFGAQIDVSSYSMTSGIGNHATSHGPQTWEFQGSNDDTNWTTLDTQSVSSWSDEEKRTFSLASPSNYRYFRFNITSTPGNSNIVISEAELLAPMNMSLVSKSFSAENIPPSARILFLANPTVTIALNTDLNAFVSRDDGTTWTKANLVETINYSNGVKVYEANSINLISQPSGTLMRWKIETLEKNIEIHGAVLQWSE